MDLLQALVAILIPLAVTLLMSLLKKSSAWVATVAPLVRSLIVAVLSFLAVKLSAAIGYPLPSDVLGWGGDVLTTILTALAAMGMHAVKKAAVATSPKVG